jgi:hypothetical protein
MTKKAEANYIVTAKNDCGCCETTMHFFGDESAKAAFDKAGLRNMATIVDDAGTEHRGIDTFYGYVPGTENKRGLGYLISKKR